MDIMVNASDAGFVSEPSSGRERAGAMAVGVEAVLLLAAALAAVVMSFRETDDARAGSIALAVLALAVAAGLAWAARAMWRAARAARGAVVAWQILQTAVAVPLLYSRPLLSIALMVPVAIAMWGVVAAVRREMRQAERESAPTTASS